VIATVARPLRRLAALVLIAAGCGDGGACPNDLPAECPSDAPGYAATIAPIVKTRCLGCHAPGGQAADKPLGTWDDVHARRSAVLNQVYSCSMPPTEGGPLGMPSTGSGLTDAERAALLGWLVCGAPND
jgi:mono/diheme cytochrome c family protein